MIKQLRLQNFRGFDDHTIPLRATTIVIGRNNAGKSTIVEALRLLSLVVNRYQGLQFGSVPKWLDIPKREKGVSPSLRNLEINLDSVFHRYQDPPASITGTFEDNLSIQLYIGPEGQVHGVIKDSDGRPIVNKGQASSLRIPGVSILPQVAPLSRDEKALSPDYVMAAMGSSLSPLHFRNQLKLLNHFFADFKELAESSWHGLRIVGLEGGRRFPEPENISLLVQDTDFVAEVGWMGHGLQMWLQMIWFLTHEKDADTVILDEPDVYMHADLQRRLIRLVKGRYKQTIIATHSTEILAEVDPDQVLIVDRTRKKSRFAPSLPAVQRVLDRIGSAHNLQLARLWSARRLLLVEGKDIAVLKHFQNTLFPDSTEPFDAIPNNSIGGWGGWSTVIGSSMFMKNAVGEDIVTYCVLDSDYRTPSQIASRREDAQRYGIQLHIWSRKEIENYLLVPTAIQRVIDYGKKRKKNAPRVGEILAKIDEIADSLYNDICDALANDFFAENKPAGVVGATRYARQRVLATWSTVDDKIVVIPGKRVLSLLSQWSQDEYGVSLSSSKLAPELRANEIDLELVRVVTAIEEGQTFPNN